MDCLIRSFVDPLISKTLQPSHTFDNTQLLASHFIFAISFKAKDKGVHLLLLCFSYSGWLSQVLCYRGLEPPCSLLVTHQCSSSQTYLMLFLESASAITFSLLGSRPLLLWLQLSTLLPSAFKSVLFHSDCGICQALFCHRNIKNSSNWRHCFKLPCLSHPPAFQNL